MADIAVVYGEELTEQTHTGDTNFFDVLTVDADKWTADANYVIWVTAQTVGNSTGLIFEMRVVHGSTPTELTGSLHVFEPGGTGAYQNYFYQNSNYTHANPAEDVKVQIRTQSSGQIAKADSIILMAMELTDLTEGDDFARGQSTATTEFTTSFVDFATTGSFTPGNNNDDWVATACTAHRVDNLDVNAEWRINLDSDTETEPTWSGEGEDIAEETVFGLLRPYTLSNSAHTIKVQARDDATGVNNHKYSDIIVLRLNVFADHNIVYTAAEITLATNNVFEEIQTFDITPTATGDFIIFGFAINDAGSVNTARMRAQKDGTSVVTGFEDHNVTRPNDDTDELPYFQMVKTSLSSGAARTIDLDGRFSSVSDSVFEDRSLVAFSIALAAAAGGVAPTSHILGALVGPLGGPVA